MPGYDSVVTFEELTNPGANVSPRTLSLSGSGLPFRGAGWGSDINVITSWYPGMDLEATQQGLGPREAPSSWEGMWRRTLLGRTPAVLTSADGGRRNIIDPFILMETLEDIARVGVRLRVTWSVRGSEVAGSGTERPINFTIAREGLVKTIRFMPDRHTDIHWSIELHWASRGRSQQRVVATRQDQDPVFSANALNASINATLAAADYRAKTLNPRIPRSASRLTLGQLESFANFPKTAVDTYTRNLRRAINTFTRIGDLSKKLVTTPLAVSNSIVDFARNTKGVSTTFVDSLGQQPIELLTLKSGVSDLGRAATVFGSVQDQARKDAKAAYELDLKTRQALIAAAGQGRINVQDSSTTRAGAIIAVYQAKQGDTPQSVSLKFYGTPDRSTDILRSNRLPWFTPTFTRGQILVIPSSTNPQRTTANPSTQTGTQSTTGGTITASTVV